MSARRVLVTGATGMIGRGLVQELQSLGEDVVEIGGRRSGGRNGTYAWRLGRPLGDTLENVDCVIHLAARVHIRGLGFSDRDSFIRENAKASLMLAREAHVWGVKRFVFASTIGVLGATSEIPLTEEGQHMPHNAYTESKSLAEQWLQEFCDSSGMQLVILRFPAVIGVGVTGNVRSLAKAVKLKLPLPISRLEKQRQFLTLQNLVSAISLAAAHHDAAGHVFHLANPERVSTFKLCQSLAAIQGVELYDWAAPEWILRSGFAALGRRSLAEGLMGSLLIDSSKASRVIGWEPRQALYQALTDALVTKL